MEGLRDLQADLPAWLQLEIPSQGQHPQGSEQRVELGAGKGRLSRELLESWMAQRLCSPPSALRLGAPVHCGLRGQSILLGGGNC